MEGERVPSADGHGLSVGTAGTTLVTPEVVGAEVGHRAIIVGILTDVLEHAVLGAAGRELLEDVVGRNLADSQRKGGNAQESLHGDG